MQPRFKQEEIEESAGDFQTYFPEIANASRHSIENGIWKYIIQLSLFKKTVETVEFVGNQIVANRRGEKTYTGVRKVYVNKSSSDERNEEKKLIEQRKHS